MLLKVHVIILLTAVIISRLGKDTSIANTNL
jgi:hypothetical protein